MVVLPGVDGRGEAGVVDGGHARVRGGPGHQAGYVLRAAVGVGPGGGKLLRHSGRECQVGRRHRYG